MNNNKKTVAFAAALAAALAVAGCKKQETPVVATPTPAPTTTLEPAAMVTVSISGIDLGTAVGPDLRVTAPSTAFAPKDTIIAAVSTATSDATATTTGKLHSKWTFSDGQVVNEETKDVVFTGNGVTDFQVSKPDGWPVGKYKLEVWLDDGAVQSREFEVK